MCKDHWKKTTNDYFWSAPSWGNATTSPLYVSLDLGIGWLKQLLKVTRHFDWGHICKKNMFCAFTRCSCALTSILLKNGNIKPKELATHFEIPPKVWAISGMLTCQKKHATCATFLLVLWCQDSFPLCSTNGNSGPTLKTVDKHFARSKTYPLSSQIWVGFPCVPVVLP